MTALAFLYLTSSQNRGFFGKASRVLTNIINESKIHTRGASAKVIEINEKKVAIPTALHRGESVVIENHMEKMKPHEKQMVLKAERFNKVVIGQNPLMYEGWLWIMVIFTIIFSISSLAYVKRFKGIIFVAYFIMLVLSSSQIFRLGQLLSGMFSMSDLCDFWSYNDPNNQVPKKGKNFEIRKMQMTQLGLAEYFECYDPGFQKLARQQLLDISIAQVT